MNIIHKIIFMNTFVIFLLSTSERGIISYIIKMIYVHDQLQTSHGSCACAQCEFSSKVISRWR